MLTVLDRFTMTSSNISINEIESEILTTLKNYPINKYNESTYYRFFLELLLVYDKEKNKQLLSFADKINKLFMDYSDNKVYEIDCWQIWRRYHPRKSVKLDIELTGTFIELGKSIIEMDYDTFCRVYPNVIKEVEPENTQLFLNHPMFNLLGKRKDELMNIDL